MDSPVDFKKEVKLNTDNNSADFSTISENDGHSEVSEQGDVEIYANLSETEENVVLEGSRRPIKKDQSTTVKVQNVKVVYDGRSKTPDYAKVVQNVTSATDNSRTDTVYVRDLCDDVRPKFDGHKSSYNRGRNRNYWNRRSPRISDDDDISKIKTLIERCSINSNLNDQKLVIKVTDVTPKRSASSNVVKVSTPSRPKSPSKPTGTIPTTTQQQYSPPTDRPPRQSYRPRYPRSRGYAYPHNAAWNPNHTASYERPYYSYPQVPYSYGYNPSYIPPASQDCYTYLPLYDYSQMYPPNPMYQNPYPRGQYTDYRYSYQGNPYQMPDMDGYTYFDYTNQNQT